MRKTFFNDDSSTNEDGSKALIKLDEYFSRIYDEYMEVGYSLREISLLIMNSMTLVEAKKSSKVQDKVVKEKREKIAIETEKKIKSLKQV